MATIIFQGEISSDSVRNLISQIEDVQEDGKIDIYFTSVGGDMSASEVLIHYLSNASKTLDITLIAYWQIASAAVDILFQSECKKELLEDTWGVLHLYSRDVETRDLLDRDSIDVFLTRELRQDNSLFLKTYAPYLTRKEMNALKKGSNAYIRHDRFVEMFEALGVHVEEETSQK